MIQMKFLHFAVLTCDSRQMPSYILVGLGHLMCAVNCFQTNFYGISFTTLNNFAPANSTKNFTTRRRFECMYTCALDPGCQATFFHFGDDLCILPDRKYADTSELQSYPGMKYVSTLPHNHRNRTLVLGYEKCGSYLINITYNVGLEAAMKIIDMSSACQQFIRWDCYSATMHSVQTTKPCVRWKNRNMEYSTYFTGSGSYPKYCDCAQMNQCFHSSGCNCNENLRIWRYDSGYVTNKDDLPITAFSAGDTGGWGNVSTNEMAYHSIGGVKCW